MGECPTSRRSVLECMVWDGAGLFWTVQGGVPRSELLGNAMAAEPGDRVRLHANQR